METTKYRSGLEQTPSDDFHMMLPMFDEWKISEHDQPCVANNY